MTGALRTVASSDVRFGGEPGLAGRLYAPLGGALRGQRLPAVVVLGSWTTVKEQMAGLYAARLAERGLLALCFDTTGWGGSDGPVRDLEDPTTKIADLRRALDRLAHEPLADPDRLGLLGICAGAGYAAVAAAQDDRVARLAMVAPWLHDAESVRPLYGGADGVRERIAASDAARERRSQDGTVAYVAAVSADDPTAAMHGPFDYYLDADRGAVQQWPNRFATEGWRGWLEFDAHPAAAALTAPTLLVHSEDAAIPDGVRSFASAVAASCRVEWLTGTQFDFYDDPDTVGAASSLAAQHLRS